MAATVARQVAALRPVVKPDHRVFADGRSTRVFQHLGQPRIDGGTCRTGKGACRHLSIPTSRLRGW